jgi:UDPglucose--hexose-1-phosphate uridylyltransferase
MELRKDYILDRWVIISEKRGERPKDFVKSAAKSEPRTCFFCPGNENTTAAEIMRKEKDGSWYIRVFKNKYPFLEETGNPQVRTDNDFYTFASAFGSHEVVVETNVHGEMLSDLSQERIAEVFKVYAERINALEKNSEYVVVFKNEGGEAGASLAHSHTQVGSMNMVPTLVQSEVTASKKNGCAYCEIIKKEKNSDRRCLENDSFLSFAPYASRFNYEIWLFPKSHIKGFKDFDEKKYDDLAEMMKKILVKIKGLNASYNFVIHYSPKGENLHFHIEILPRISSWAGFEFSTGITINSVSPESAAEYYRS